jgi:beta-mannosidase
MEILSLNGQWSLFQADHAEAVPALVPGCVHTDLLRNNRIPDPFYRDNELGLFWIAETDWSYQRTFTVSAALLQQPHVVLRCLGLDTLATITVNGAAVGVANNMYRTWEFDVKPHLRAGENEIRIVFAALMPFLRQEEAEKGVLYAWSIGAHRLNSGAWIRKMPSNFGWDWGAMLPTSGIWRDIEIVGFDARIRDVAILQAHNDGVVDLTITVQADSLSSAPQTVAVQLEHNGNVVASAESTLTQSAAQLTVRIENPALWWINGLGDQPLYNVTVTLQAGQHVQDTVTKRIGLRELTLERHTDQWGESFYFACNKIPFFAKGANWIPVNAFPGSATPDEYRRPLQAAADAHMNMLRVWGGGIYEVEDFYDRCDELGIAVWQDFMFACGTYPTYDAEWMANVRGEAEDNIRRIRHHASLALWCGNNEMEQGLVSTEWTSISMSWDDYSKLFDTLLPDLVRQLDPQRAYWPGSPHTPVGNRANWQNPDAGDTHLWSVWHGKEPFEWYRARPDRFCSEFGFQSFPSPAIINEFTEPSDRNITSYVMEHHQRSGIGNSTIIHYMLDWFRLPTQFENIAWVSQILQGMAMKYAVEHWRRNMPRTMGTLYWQLNDLWPAPTWSSLDWRGNWKALHYIAKRFYAPLLISGVEDISTSKVDIHVTSDTTQTQGILRWIVTDVQGKSLQQGEMPVTIPERASLCAHTLDVAAEVAAHKARGILVFLELLVDGHIISDNLVLLTRPKHLELQQPKISTDVKQVASGEYAVTLRSDVPALYVWLEQPGASFSDNFFNLRPGINHTVHITAENVAALQIHSLVDTYSG